MRKPVAVLLGSLAVVLCFGAVASAGIITPSKVSASVSPHHVTKAPYTFTTHGTITFSPLYCPPGTTNVAYCTTITKAEACSGKVSLKVKLGPDPILADADTTIKSTTGKVSSNCTYSIKTKFSTKDFTATKIYSAHEKGVYVKVKFSVKFLGNTVLNPKSANTQTVIAKLTKP
ncbi:MAG TPA: hypothetical protein VG294_09320 [Solirubrobacteraceae bacterium]|nr:hypothetical protein [Solirubrobacteraceae bacterium]